MTPFKRECIHTAVAALVTATGITAASASPTTYIYNSDGFEGPEFGLGAIGGQGSPVWLDESAPGTTASIIDNVSAPVGSTGQVLEVTRGSNTDPALGFEEFGEFYVDFSALNLPTAAVNQIAIDWDMYVPATGSTSIFGPAFGVIATNDTTDEYTLGSLYLDAATGEVLISQTAFGGSTFIIPDESTPDPTDTVSAPLNAWNAFRIELDFTAASSSLEQVKYFVNDVLVFSDDFSDTGFGDVSGFTDAPIFTTFANPDDDAYRQGGNAFFDNYRLSIIPEPGTATLMLSAPALLAFRRRRSA